MNEDPFRLRVLKRMCEALEEIHPGNGYIHDLRNAAFRGRDAFGDNDPVPMVCLLESIEEDEQVPSPTTAAQNYGPWTIQVQGFVTDDRRNPTDPAHRLMAEVKKRLVEERRRERGMDILGLGSRITDLAISRGIVRPADEISDKAYFWLRVRLTLVENLADPYE